MNDSINAERAAIDFAQEGEWPEGGRHARYRAFREGVAIAKESTQ